MMNNQLLNYLLEGDYRSSSGVVKKLLEASVPAKDIYENLLKPAMYKVGELWEENKISVATEHLASAIVETLLNEIYYNLRVSANSGKTAIITCLENEYHQIGARMVADLFDLMGWKVLFLGANLPQKDLLDYIGTIRPTLVGISLSIYFNLPLLHSTLDEITDKFPELPILTGGQAFKKGGQNSLAEYKSVEYLPDLFALENYLKTTN